MPPSIIPWRTTATAALGKRVDGAEHHPPAITADLTAPRHAVRARVSRKAGLATLLAVALLAVAAPLAGAQDLRAVGGLGPFGHASSAAARKTDLATSAASEKIVSRLRALIADFQSLGITSQNAAAMGAAGRFSSAARRVDDAGRVQVDVTVADTSDAALAPLRAHGLDIEIVNADFRVVEGWIPVENLELLAGEPVVLKIRPPSYGTTRTGSVTSQGDAVHRCNQARTLGFTGTGAPVGVISNGVAGLAASQATGDLPPGVTVLANAPGDEGTAMLEIVHDCAPGAPLLFATGSPTALAFVNAVNTLQAAGARIIVDDLGYYDQPYFEDGLIALNDRAVGQSVLRVSAAGNDRIGHYAAALFSPGVFDPDVPGTRHNFGGGDTLMRFTVPGGTSFDVFLQWANPFGASGDDYDLCVRQTTGALIDCSADLSRTATTTRSRSSRSRALPALRAPQTSRSRASPARRSLSSSSAWAARSWSSPSPAAASSGILPSPKCSPSRPPSPAPRRSSRAPVRRGRRRSCSRRRRPGRNPTSPVSTA